MLDRSKISLMLVVDQRSTVKLSFWTPVILSKAKGYYSVTRQGLSLVLSKFARRSVQRETQQTGIECYFRCILFAYLHRDTVILD